MTALSRRKAVRFGASPSSRYKRNVAEKAAEMAAEKNKIQMSTVVSQN